MLALDPAMQLLAVDGIGVMLAAVLVAGVVYGFAGFGPALVAIPVLTRYLEPEVAVLAFGMSGLGAAVTMLPRVWPQADQRATLWMLLAAAITAPPCLWLLANADPRPLRWAICAAAALALIGVATGWRVRLGSGPGPRMALGAATGAVGGATGLTGPVVILAELASGDGAGRMRANMATFLNALNFIFLPTLILLGAFSMQALWLGALFLPLYVFGAEIGHRLFRPGLERFYRRLACLVVGASVLTSLPAFD